jgi:hypothetical protein
MSQKEGAMASIDSRQIALDLLIVKLKYQNKNFNQEKDKLTKVYLAKISDLQGLVEQLRGRALEVGSLGFGSRAGSTPGVGLMGGWGRGSVGELFKTPTTDSSSMVHQKIKDNEKIRDNEKIKITGAGFEAGAMGGGGGRPVEKI